MGERPVRKWEYRVELSKKPVPARLDLIGSVEEAEAELNALGDLGWELVQQITHDFGGSTYIWRCWKRERLS